MSRQFLHISLVSLLVLGALYFATHMNDDLDKIEQEVVSQTVSDGFLAADEYLSNGGIMYSDREVLVTDGVKHTVPLDEILGGGPPKDGIPSIDDPQFTSVTEARNFLDDTDVGITFKLNGTTRFYPFKILVWHEIVNDTIHGNPVLITYCPLCFSGIVFEPMVNGKPTKFGTSGKLWNSNLVMYDRQTDSYWSQILGEAIKGELAGQKLNVLPFDQMRFGEFAQKYPDAEILSKDTGAQRFYGHDPYGDYYTTPDLIFPVSNRDERLPDKEYILGLVLNGAAKAYQPGLIKEKGLVNDSLGGEKIQIKYIKDLDVVRMYTFNSDGTKQQVNPFPSYWFSWVASHPKTEVYQ